MREPTIRVYVGELNSLCICVFEGSIIHLASEVVSISSCPNCPYTIRKNFRPEKKFVKLLVSNILPISKAIQRKKVSGLKLRGLSGFGTEISTKLLSVDTIKEDMI